VSFILDALRKSEHERQRSAVPGISQVALSAPRREMPRWAIAVIATLALAVVALGGAWWLSTGDDAEAPQAVSEAPTQRSIPLDVPRRPPLPPLSRPERSARTEPAAVAATSPPPSRPSEEPIVAPPPRGTAPRGAESAAAEPPLPSAAALTLEGVAVPPLRLELHAYSETPADRFVFINGARYREGENLRDGPQLVSIERNGVILSQQGRRFLLGPE
jgi:general secretion pathway protein B